MTKEDYRSSLLRRMQMEAEGSVWHLTINDPTDTQQLESMKKFGRVAVWDKAGNLIYHFEGKTQDEVEWPYRNGFPKRP